MSTFTGLITQSDIHASQIECSSLRHCCIDMGHREIFNVQTPSHPNSAVPKAYVDKYLQDSDQPTKGVHLVTLTATDPSTLDFLIKGAYTLTIWSTISQSPCGVFAIGKSHLMKEGVANRIVSSPGAGPGRPIHLKLEWPAGSSPQLHKTGPFYDGEYQVLVNYDQQAATTLPKGDTYVTKADVDEMIQSVLVNEWASLKIALVGTKSKPLGQFETGAFVITIQGVGDDLPACTVECSKSSATKPAHIVYTSTATVDTSPRTRLEVAWDPNKPLMLRKTTLACDATYIVNFSQRLTLANTNDNEDNDGGQKSGHECIKCDASQSFFLAGTQSVQLLCPTGNFNFIKITTTEDAFPSAVYLTCGSALSTLYSHTEMDCSLTCTFDKVTITVSKSTSGYDALYTVLFY